MTEPKPLSRAAGIAFVSLTLVSWGTVLLFLKHLTGHIDAWTANGWRYSIAAIFWLPILLMGWRRGDLPERLWRRAFIPAAFNIAGQVLYAFAPYYIGPGLAGFLLRVSLISSTAGALILFVDERPLARSATFWMGMALVAGGTVGTVLMGTTPLSGAGGFGIVMALLSGAFFGMYGVSVRYCMRGVPSLTAFSVISLLTAMGMVALMIPMGRRHGLEALDLSAMNWFLLISSALVGIAAGHTCYYAAITRLGVAVSTAIVQISPFLTAIGGVILFGERLMAGQWGSGFVMLGGAWLLLRAEQARHTKRDEVIQSERMPVTPLEVAGPAAALALEHAEGLSPTRGHSSK